MFPQIDTWEQAFEHPYFLWLLVLGDTTRREAKEDREGKGRTLIE